MKEKIEQTYKSNDTEEWLDVVWTRPIGYQWARLFDALNVHPNTVTILSMIIGVASAYFFFSGSYRTARRRSSDASSTGRLAMCGSSPSIMR